MARTALFAAGGVAILAAGLAWSTGCFDQDVANEPQGAVDAAPEQTRRERAPAAPAQGAFVAVSERPQEDVDERTTMLLPDGSRVATLNGATDVRPMQEVWPKGRPWSPIVGVERSDVGVDWYVHADGCRSTTEMRWRADLGRADALTRIAQPIPAGAKQVTAPPR